MADLPNEEGQRFGFVALVGAPNVGKSTLVNALVRAKVSIVTHKVQTTRMPIRAAYVEGDAQVILVDTPGIFKPARRLDRAMVDSAWSGAGDADAILALIDASKGLTDEDRAVFAKLQAMTKPLILAINKIDRIDHSALLELIATCNDVVSFTETLLISALNGDGVQALREKLADIVPLGFWHYPEDHLSDLPGRMLAAEITREKLFLRVHDELPYALTVETESWSTRKDGSAKIDQVIYVARESHRKIIIGKKGQGLKAVGAAARAEIAELLGHPVHLFLFVKVREKWVDDPNRYREIGLDFPS